MPRVGVFVAYAGWAGRETALRRLTSQLGDAVTVVPSEVREHASTWAERLYRTALASDADYLCFLNDDVIVCPSFVEVLTAMHCARPSDPLSLHTTAPWAPDFKRAGLRWFRSHWYTGPAVSFPRAALQSLVAYRARLPRWFVESRNEDNVAMQWSWHGDAPFWHPLPAIVRHDVSVPSTLGYDHHPMRTASVTWEEDAARLADPSFWLEAHTPIQMDCPWLPSQVLRMFQCMVGL